MLATHSLWAEDNKAILDRLVKQEKYGKIIQVMDTPQEKTSTNLIYKFKEIEMKPNDVMYFYVPDTYTLRPVSQVSMGIRQNEWPTERDSEPALLAVMIHDSNYLQDEMRYWAGHSSGSFGAKFAEQRRSAEIDSLYEWPIQGHKGTVKRIKSLDPVHANAIRIQNFGVDELLVSQISLEVIPQKALTYAETIFSPRSSFGDPESMKGRTYGGGQKYQGKFPGALKLDSKNQKNQPVLPPNMTLDDNELIIDPQTQSKLKIVDLMLGDTHPDGVTNKDGGTGSLGNAKISIEVRNIVTKESRILVDEKNVGPQGVISGGDAISAAPLDPNERIIIRNKRGRSTAYIMAIRLGFE